MCRFGCAGGSYLPGAGESWQHVARHPEYSRFIQRGDTVETRDDVEGVWKKSEKATVNRGSPDESRSSGDEEPLDDDFNDDAPILVTFDGEEPRRIATQAWRLRRVADAQDTAVQATHFGDGGAGVDFDELPWQVSLLQATVSSFLWNVGHLDQPPRSVQPHTPMLHVDWVCSLDSTPHQTPPRLLPLCRTTR
jgi:hypothetical protein